MRRAAACLVLLALAALPAAAADRSYWTYALPPLEGAGSPGAPGCEPFFDDDPATEFQPPAPATDEFDRAVLRACGPLGGRVGETELRALFADHPQAVEAALPEAWRALPRVEALARLARAWTARGGFDHVFCGDWQDGRVGGLHFRARYLQLQREGAACFWSSGRQEVEPGLIYTFGVASADGRYRHPIKGYGLTQSAVDLLRLGAEAFLACCLAGDQPWEPYRTWYSRQFFVTSGEGGREFANRVICSAEAPGDSASMGLVTLFPDATPVEPYPRCPL